MAAPTKKLYIGVTVALLLFIPAGVVINYWGPEIADAWRWRHLGKPVERKGRVVGYAVSSGYRGRAIYELDLSGKVVRGWPARYGCFGLEVLANGNLLLGFEGKVEELDHEGKVVWELPAAVGLFRVRDISRLGNGNTLVADANGGRVIEFTPAGAEVWSYKCDKYPRSAQRLRNGKTLIGSGSGDGRVFEVSPAGEIVWEKKGIECPFHVRRLANGKTLIADYNQSKVIEIDRDGEVVWEYKCEEPIGAERLPDGRTLVSSARGVFLVSPDGKEEVLYKGAQGRACAIYEER